MLLTHLAFVLVAQAVPTPALPEVKVDGYLEFRKNDFVVVEAQRLRLAPSGRLKMKGNPSATLADIPIGYEVKAKGVRAPDGTLIASEIETKPNGSRFGEKDVINQSDQAEKAFVARNAIFQAANGGGIESLGEMWIAGPEWERARAIVDAVAPSHIDRSSIRVYVVNNPEWNAMAMANYSIYVFSGLMADLDDDELAIVLGHELAHASYEHSARGVKKGLIGAVLGGVADEIVQRATKGNTEATLRAAVALTAAGFTNKFDRNYEDQADRVGLRYVYEAGFDYRKAPALWNKFAKKYGDQNKAVNFLFGDHSLSSQRASNLEKEIANNYVGVADPPLRADPPVVRFTAEAVRLTPSGSVGQPQALSLASLQGGVGLQQRTLATSPQRPPEPPPPAKQTVKQDLRPGMTPLDVIEIMGKPEKEQTFGKTSRWVYADMIVKFDSGRVIAVDFK